MSFLMGRSSGSSFIGVAGVRILDSLGMDRSNLKEGRSGRIGGPPPKDVRPPTEIRVKLNGLGVGIS